MVTIILSFMVTLGFVLGVLIDRTFKREMDAMLFILKKGWKQFKLDMKDFFIWLVKMLNGVRLLIIFPFLAMKRGADQARTELIAEKNGEVNVG